MLGRVSGLLTGVAALVATVPGVALVATLTPLPEDVARQIQIWTLAASALCAMALLLNAGRILGLGSRAFALVVGIALGLAAITMPVYVSVAKNHVFPREPDPGETLKLTPLMPSEELATLVGRFHGDYDEASLNPRVGSDVDRLIEAENYDTTLLLVALALCMQAGLLSAILMTAIRLAGADTRSA